MLETWVLYVYLFAASYSLAWERTPGLSEAECKEMAWEVDPAQGVARCFRWGQPKSYNWSPPWHDEPTPPIRDRPVLPGRKRVEMPGWKLAPHICGYAACWPTNGPGNALLPVREPH